jgi:hypothetical protein
VNTVAFRASITPRTNEVSSSVEACRTTAERTAPAWSRVAPRTNVLAVPLGLFAVAAPWLAGGPWPGLVAGSLAGLGVAALALPRGPKTERYGAWDRFVR